MDRSPITFTVRTRSRSRLESVEEDVEEVVDNCGQAVNLSPVIEQNSVDSLEELEEEDEQEEGQQQRQQEEEEEQEEDMAERGPIIQPPKFKGGVEENADEYLQSFERVSRANGWNDNKKLVILPCYLESAALKWYENLEQAEGDNLTWALVKQRMTGAFQSIAREEQLEYRLRMRMQGENESVESYLQDVINLCTKLDAAMDERMKIKHVLRGLTPSLLEKVMLMENNSLEALLANIRKIQTARYMAGQRVDHILSEPVRGAVLAAPSKNEGPVQSTSNALESKIESLTSAFEKINMRLLAQEKRGREPVRADQRRGGEESGRRRSPRSGERAPRSNDRGRGYDVNNRGRGYGYTSGMARGRTSDGRVICYKCNRPGHYAAVCRAPVQGNGNEGR